MVPGPTHRLTMRRRLPPCRIGHRCGASAATALGPIARSKMRLRGTPIAAFMVTITAQGHCGAFPMPEASGARSAVPAGHSDMRDGIAETPRWVGAILDLRLLLGAAR